MYFKGGELSAKKPWARGNNCKGQTRARVAATWLLTLAEQIRNASNVISKRYM